MGRVTIVDGPIAAPAADPSPPPRRLLKVAALRSTRVRPDPEIELPLFRAPDRARGLIVGLIITLV
ncbi:dolichyl-phosphate-mannose--protein mannosyltransferase, partial [Mycobacterium tuberculosis]|nr:dolichyl-phosphate-mannose--protein mannosyltransferase [Mycobacterium tuberculosis]